MFFFKHSFFYFWRIIQQIPDNDITPSFRGLDRGGQECHILVPLRVAPVSEGTGVKSEPCAFLTSSLSHLLGMFCVSSPSASWDSAHAACLRPQHQHAPCSLSGYLSHHQALPHHARSSQDGIPLISHRTVNHSQWCVSGASNTMANTPQIIVFITSESPDFISQKALDLVNLSYQWHFLNSACPVTQSWLTKTVVLMLLLTYVIFMPVPTANSLQLLLDSVVFALLPRS